MIKILAATAALGLALGAMTANAATYNGIDPAYTDGNGKLSKGTHGGQHAQNDNGSVYTEQDLELAQRAHAGTVRQRDRYAASLPYGPPTKSQSDRLKAWNNMVESTGNYVRKIELDMLGVRGGDSASTNDRMKATAKANIAAGKDANGAPRRN